MATIIFKPSLLFKNVFDNPCQHILGGVRGAKVSKHIGPRKGGIPKNYGPRKQDGDTVSRGTILARQFHFKYCAGLNAGHSRGTIYAKVSGKVVVTNEVTNFDPDNKLVMKLCPSKTKLLMPHYHVIPEPQRQRFKLIDTN